MNTILDTEAYSIDPVNFSIRSRSEHRGAFGEDLVPEWWSSAIQRILFLLELPDNWDSYGAKKVDRNIAFQAVQILQQISRPDIPPPSIVPTVNGRLQFEWHTNGIDLEFEVMSAALISASYEDHNSDIEWDKDLDYNLSPLTEVLKTLVPPYGPDVLSIGY